MHGEPERIGVRVAALTLLVAVIASSGLTQASCLQKASRLLHYSSVRLCVSGA